MLWIPHWLEYPFNLRYLALQRYKKSGAIARLLSRNVNVDKLKLQQDVTHGRNLHASCCIISKNDRRFLINLYPADHSICRLNTVECRSYPLRGASVLELGGYLAVDQTFLWANQGSDFFRSNVVANDMRTNKYIGT